LWRWTYLNSNGIYLAFYQGFDLATNIGVVWHRNHLLKLVIKEEPTTSCLLGKCEQNQLINSVGTFMDENLADRLHRFR